MSYEDIAVRFIQSKGYDADMLTKSLRRAIFKAHQKIIMNLSE